MIEYDIQQSPLRNTGGINVPVPRYETGLWTPALSCATPGDLSVTYNSQTGRYTIIGDQVFIEGEFATSTFTHSTASGEVRITGIPDKLKFITPSVFRIIVGPFMGQGITKANYTQFALTLSINEAYFNVLGAAQGQVLSFVTIAQMPSGGSPNFFFSISYSLDART